MKLKYTNLDYDLINCKDLLIELDELPSGYNLNGLRVVGHKQSSLGNFQPWINDLIRYFNQSLVSINNLIIDNPNSSEYVILKEKVENLRDNITFYIGTYELVDEWKKVIKDIKVTLEIKNGNLTLNGKTVTEEQYLKYINSKIGNSSDKIAWIMYGTNWHEEIMELYQDPILRQHQLYLNNEESAYNDIVSSLQNFLNVLILKPTVEKTTTLFDITKYRSNSGEEEGENYEGGDEGEGEGDEGIPTKRYLKSDFLYRYITDIRFSEEPNINSDWWLTFLSDDFYIEYTINNGFSARSIGSNEQYKTYSDKNYILNDYLNDFIKKFIENGNFMITEDTSNNTEILDQLCSLIQVKYLDYE